MSRQSVPRAILVDLLMATMDSMSVWADAAGDRDLGLRWRDAVTERMIAAGTYRSYDGLVAEAATALGLEADAPARLAAAWHAIRPWADAASLDRLRVPLGFVTNCSTELGELAVRRSGLRPALVVSAQEAGFYKPRPEIYRAACRRLAVPAAAVLFVAGAAYDAVGARSAGLQACLVARRAVPQPFDPAIPVVATLEAAVGGT